MYIKRLIKQLLLRILFRKGNKIGRNVNLSFDLKIGKNVIIYDYASIGKDVVLCDNVTIGARSVIRRATIGENSYVDGGVIITGNKKGHVTIGKETYIGINNVLDFSDDISIGNYVHIAGPSTGLWTHSSAKMCLNSISLNSKDEKYRPTAPIIIEDNVYIGGNCTIYPGIIIGHHTIIAPNNAVTKNVEPHTMVGGVPAKFIKHV